MGKRKEHVVKQTEVTNTEETKEAVVDGVDSMLNIRSTPEVKEDNVISTVKKGMKIIVVDPKKEENGFYKIIVKDKKDVKGFAMKKYIKII